MSRLPAFLLLTLVYVLTLASFAPWDIAAGAALSAVLLVGLRRFVFAGEGGRRPPLGRRLVGFLRFALATGREVAIGTWRVTLAVTGLRPLARPGIVAVPIDDRTPAGVAASALAATLSPGEVLVDVDEVRGVMLMHVLDASDPEAVRERYARFYERYQRQVFP